MAQQRESLAALAGACHFTKLNRTDGREHYGSALQRSVRRLRITMPVITSAAPNAKSRQPRPVPALARSEAGGINVCVRRGER